MGFSGAFLVAQLVKNPPAMWETWVPSLGWEDPLEKGMTTHSSILAWKIPWTIMGSQKIGCNWATFTFMLTVKWISYTYTYIHSFFFLDSFFIQSQLPVELSQWESPTSGSLREESDFSFSSSIKYWVASGWPWLQSSAKGSCPQALQGWGHDGSLHVQAPECLTMLCCFPNSVHIPIKCSVSYQNVGWLRN